MHTVIGIDVSKATSQVAVAVDGKVVQNFKITHDVFGFNQLNSVIMQFNTFPDIVFEATGVYSRRLKTFLEAHNYPYTYLNPLTAKKQLDQLRPNKNDLNDAKHLAETQFILKRAKSYVQNPIYIELQDMSRFYQQLNHDIVSAKNRLHRLLQLTFPEIETLFSTTDSQQYWEIVSLIPHATMAKHSRQTLSDTIQSSVSRQIGVARLTRLVDKLVALGSLSAPAVAVASYNVTEVRYYAQRLIALSQSKANVLATMVDQAKDLPEYDIYQSIPGFSDKTVVSLIAELGDLHRFATSNKLNAFVGMTYDLMIQVIIKVLGSSQSEVIQSPEKCYSKPLVTLLVRQLMVIKIISMIGIKRKSNLQCQREQRKLLLVRCHVSYEPCTIWF